MTSRRFRTAVILCILLAGCDAPIALDTTITPEAQEAALPELAPIEPLLQGPETRLTPEDAEQLIARGQAADAKASSLR